ncbi:Alpha/beta hydrolase family protein [Enhygromyxa salina]|uniref:Alpha/beta hydrolase family protein n=1 Tax=Enhygromyxa salina TaxID=215803 RepID=A0A2S9XKB2_9BACT|nr:alpha/beta hydrolase [Enhygromyxa salina]PRP93293.1 Alpha/beta hydrolase family protein [Enhygromyxa salina]
MTTKCCYHNVPVVLFTAWLGLGASACGDDGEPGVEQGSDETSGDENSGDGDGDGDGDPTGDGDGDGDGDPAGDGDGDPTGDGDGDPTGDGDGDPVGQDYRNPGPRSVSVGEGSMQVTPECDLSYGVFEPDVADSDTPVLLAHGFMRSIDDMAETARHIASWGVTVYTVPLCTNSFAIDHQQNGEAIAALGQAIAPEGAVYSGFSAGGLAAFVAAATDQSAVAFVGLDAVDNADLGLGLADQASPARGSIAAPGQCNTNNNFLPVYDAIPGAPVIQIVDAEHFDFETDACAPGDFSCTLCAPAGPETHALALGMTTAGILIETGADPGGETWWMPGGEFFDMFIQQGQITLIQ